MREPKRVDWFGNATLTTTWHISTCCTNGRSAARSHVSTLSQILHYCYLLLPNKFKPGTLSGDKVLLERTCRISCLATFDSIALDRLASFKRCSRHAKIVASGSRRCWNYTINNKPGRFPRFLHVAMLTIWLRLLLSVFFTTQVRAATYCPSSPPRVEYSWVHLSFGVISY